VPATDPEHDGPGHQRGGDDARAHVHREHADQMRATPVEVVGRGVGQVDDERLDHRPPDQVGAEDPEQDNAYSLHAVDAMAGAARAESELAALTSPW
jgi:hypothetical protein